ncbi:hypothetical protein HAZT_HAZT002943 [Hyalella azteca]|nr:hypothetical protein HAZT_HAZT002943 [Hyalella azteca]
MAQDTRNNPYYAAADNNDSTSSLASSPSRSTQELRDAIRDGLIYMDLQAERQRTGSPGLSPPPSGLEASMNGGCKIHGPAVLADQLGVGVPLGCPDLGNKGTIPSTYPLGCAGGTRTRYCPEVIRAFEGVRYIAENTRREEESLRVKEDWKYVAMVLDRLFLWIFTLAVLLGTAGIILQAPTLYDDRLPIDMKISEIIAIGSRGVQGRAGK